MLRGPNVENLSNQFALFMRPRPIYILYFLFINELSYIFYNQSHLKYHTQIYAFRRFKLYKLRSMHHIWT